MSDLTLGFLPSATLVGGHLNGFEQSSSMLLRLFLEPTGLRGRFLTTAGLLEATAGLLVAGLLVASGASNSSTSPTNVGVSSSTSSSGAVAGRMAFRNPLLGVVLGASSSVTEEPGLGDCGR